MNQTTKVSKFTIQFPSNFLLRGKMGSDPIFFPAARLRTSPWPPGALRPRRSRLGWAKELLMRSESMDGFSGLNPWFCGMDFWEFHQESMDWWLVGGLVAINFIFPYIGNNHPNWRSYFSEGWPNHQPDGIYTENEWISDGPMDGYLGNSAGETHGFGKPPNAGLSGFGLGFKPVLGMTLPAWKWTRNTRTRAKNLGDASIDGLVLAGFVGVILSLWETEKTMVTTEDFGQVGCINRIYTGERLWLPWQT